MPPRVLPMDVLYKVFDDRYNFNYRGEWDGDASYLPGDVVDHATFTFRAILPNTGVVPVNGVTWALRVDMPSMAGVVAMSEAASINATNAGEYAEVATAAALTATTSAAATAAIVGDQQEALDSFETRVGAVEVGQSAAVIGYATQEQLYSNLIPGHGSVAYVINDPAPANNGTYRKFAATGVGYWVQGGFDRVAVVEGRVDANDATLTRVKSAFPLGAVVQKTYANTTPRVAVSAGIFGWGSPYLFSAAFDRVNIKILTDVNAVNIRLEVLKSDFATVVASVDFAAPIAGNVLYSILLPKLIDATVITDGVFYLRYSNVAKASALYHDNSGSWPTSIANVATYPQKYYIAGGWNTATSASIYCPVADLHNSISGPLVQQPVTDALATRTASLEGKTTTLETRAAALGAMAVDSTGRLTGAYSDGVMYQHPRGETEMTGVGQTYGNATMGAYMPLPFGATFNQIEFYAFASSGTPSAELRVYEVAYNPATKVGAFSLAGETLKSTVALNLATLVNTTLQLQKVLLPADITITPGKYMVVTLVMSGTGSITMGRQDNTYSDRTALMYSATRDVTAFVLGSAGFAQCSFRLRYNTSLDTRMTVLENGAVQTDANNAIRMGYVPYVAWAPVLGDAEMDGNQSYDYAAKVIGYYETMTAVATFNALVARMWSIDPAADVQWRVWVRSSAATFNTTTETPSDSGTIPAANFPHSNTLYTLRLNKALKAVAGQVVFILFKAANDTIVATRYWNADTVPARHGWPMAIPAGWPTALGFTSAPAYCQAGIKLLLESEEIRIKGAATPSAATTTYTPSPSMVATQLQAAIDELALRANSLPRIILPDEIVAVVGDTLQLFHRGFIESNNPAADSVVVTCPVGITYPRYFHYVPVVGDVGTKTFKAEVQNSLCINKASKTINLTVVNPVGQPATTKNVLCIGDSLTAGGDWPKEMQRRICQAGGSPAGKNYGNTNFLGTCGVAPQRWEGYGGWTWGNYLGTGVTAYWITVASHDKTVADQKAHYVDINGNQWEIETIEAGRLKMMAYSHAAAMPASGNLTWVSGGTHTTAIVFTASAAEPATPFWNGGTGLVDFTNYCTVNGFAGIDIVYILLGWNGMPGANKYLAADHAVTIASAKTLINYVRAAYPAAKIRLLGLQTPSPLGGLGANYGANTYLANYYQFLRTVNGYNLALQDLANDVLYSAFTKYLAVAPQFDSDYNTLWADTGVNTRNAVTERLGTNGVHPAISGYYQIADVAYRDFIRTYCS